MSGLEKRLSLTTGSREVPRIPVGVETSYQEFSLKYVGINLVKITFPNGKEVRTHPQNIKVDGISKVKHEFSNNGYGSNRHKRAWEYFGAVVDRIYHQEKGK